MGAEQVARAPESLNPSVDDAKRAPDQQAVNTDNDATKKAGELAIDREELRNDPYVKAASEAGFSVTKLKGQKDNTTSYSAELVGVKGSLSVLLSESEVKVQFETYDPMGVASQRYENIAKKEGKEMIPRMMKSIAASYIEKRKQ